MGVLKQKGTQRQDTQILVPASPLSSHVSMLCRCISHKLGFLIGKMGAKRPTSPGGDGVLLKSQVQERFMKRNIWTVGCCQFQCLDKSTSPSFLCSQFHSLNASPTSEVLALASSDSQVAISNAFFKKKKKKDMSKSEPQCWLDL